MAIPPPIVWAREYRGGGNYTETRAGFSLTWAVLVHGLLSFGLSLHSTLEYSKKHHPQSKKSWLQHKNLWHQKSTSRDASVRQ